MRIAPDARWFNNVSASAPVRGDPVLTNSKSSVFSILLLLCNRVANFWSRLPHYVSRERYLSKTDSVYDLQLIEAFDSK